MSVTEFITGMGENVVNTIGSATPTQSAVMGGIGGAIVGGGAVAIGNAIINRKKRKRKSKSSKSRNRKHRKRGRRTPHTAGKRRDTSRRRIRYTKKGQPYVIVKGGKARFIKKSSAKKSHKLKGGRY